MYDHRHGRGLGCRCANTARPWHLLGTQPSRDLLPLSPDLLLPCPGDVNDVGPSASQPAWLGPTLWGMRFLEGSLGSLLGVTVVGRCFPKKHIYTQPHINNILWRHLHPWQGVVSAHLDHLGSHLHHLGSHLPGRIRNRQLSKLPLTGAKLPLLQVTHPLKQQWI